MYSRGDGDTLRLPKNVEPDMGAEGLGCQHFNFPAEPILEKKADIHMESTCIRGDLQSLPSQAPFTHDQSTRRRASRILRRLRPGSTRASVPGAALVIERGDPLGEARSTRVECERLLQAYRREAAISANKARSRSAGKPRFR